MNKLYDPQQKLSDHFKMYEMIKSGTADRHEIDQTKYLTPEIISNAEFVAENVAEKIRKKYGSFSPNSWFRSEPLEKVLCHRSYLNWCKKYRLTVDAASWDKYFARKAHPKGASMDIEIVGVSNDDLFEWCKEELDYDQLIREFPKEGDPMSGWVHISSFSEGNRKQAFTIG